MRNLGNISILGILGTIASFSTLGFLTILTSKLMNSIWEEFRLSNLECLMLASVLCATDTVSALTIVKEHRFPKLNSIMFGEGVLNDAVAILLFKSVEKVIQKQQGFSLNKIFSWTDIATMHLNFFYLSSASIAIGLFFGILTCLVLKFMPKLKESPVREISILLLLGYLSYMLSEILGQSPILALFVCAFVQA